MRDQLRGVTHSHHHHHHHHHHHRRKEEKAQIHTRARYANFQHDMHQSAPQQRVFCFTVWRRLTCPPAYKFLVRPNTGDILRRIRDGDANGIKLLGRYASKSKLFRSTEVGGALLEPLSSLTSHQLGRILKQCIAASRCFKDSEMEGLLLEIREQHLPSHDASHSQRRNVVSGPGL